jgi:hypothetical protein
VGAGELGSGSGPTKHVQRVPVPLQGLGRGGQQGPGAVDQSEGEGSAGRGRAFLQAEKCTFSQVSPTGADGCLHQVGQ